MLLHYIIFILFISFYSYSLPDAFLLSYGYQLIMLQVLYNPAECWSLNQFASFRCLLS